MTLWNKVCETNPNETKAVSYGARKFTAIDAYAQIMRATELWGPYGGKWGFADLKIWDSNEYVFMTATFYAPDKDDSGISFPVANNIKLDKDCIKKIITDTLTKALSFLGFNADVFLGKWDDNKYVADMKKKTTIPKGFVPPTEEQKKAMKDMLADAGKVNPGKYLTSKDAKEFKLTELNSDQFAARFDELNKEFAK